MLAMYAGPYLCDYVSDCNEDCSRAVLNLHEDLGQDVETQKVDELGVAWSNGLGESCSKSERWEVLDSLGGKRVKSEWESSQCADLLSWFGVVTATLSTGINSSSREGSTESVGAVEIL